MSVVKSKRGESDLAIINKSRELAVYTARICSNEKNFPKRYRWCITSKIVSDAFDIYGNIRKANTIFVKIRPDYDIRRQCQNKARGALDSLHIRYMDDFILIHQDKEHLEYCLDEINKYLASLDLKLSTKKTQIFPLKQGIKFLGFIFHLTETGKVIRKLRKENVTHEKRKLRRMKKLVDEGVLTKEHVDECYASWKAHAKQGNTYNLILSMNKFYKNLWKEGGNNV
jgi:hypothetical protein